MEPLEPMEPMSVGDLVKVGGDGPQLDGIVFDIPSSAKVVVAVVDRKRGPVFRSVSPKILEERATEGAADNALRLLIRRTPAPSHGAVREGGGAARGSRGHAKATMHRTTGK